MRLADGGIKPIGERHKMRKRALAQQQGQGLREAAGVSDQIPVACKSHQALHSGEVDAVGGENGVGRVGGVAHVILFGMADDIGAAQALEHADLNFLLAEPNQTIEALRKAIHVFAGQANDKIDVNMRVMLPVV